MSEWLHSVNDIRKRRETTTSRRHAAMSQKRLVTIEDSLDTLGGISRAKLYGLVKDGELTKVNIGRRGFITADRIDACIGRTEAAHA
jgi:predicted DNA-binding transcriptional regulator AlpA